MAFVKDGYVFYYSKAQDSFHKIGLGTDPALSPDGNHLAYTVKNNANDSRTIIIVDLKSGRNKSMDIKSDHYGPVWNQDGSLLAFHLWHQDQWRIGLLNQANEYKLLFNESNNHEWVGFSWSNEPDLLLTFTSDTLLVIDTAGVVKQAFAIKEISQGKTSSSQSKFTLTPDNRYIFFNIINPEAHYPPDQYRPNAPDALYKYDLENNLVSKLTPDSLNCLQYCWSHQDSIYFTATPIALKNRTSNIYSIHSNGTGLKKILSNAESMSVYIRK